MTKSEIEPKRFLVKKRLKQALMLVGILIITLALSGCEKFVETDVSAETRLQTTATEILETQSKECQKKFVEPIGKDSYGSPAYPLPDDWTFEKIVNLIEIDGVSLSLSSDPKDFNNINKKIKSEWDKNFQSYYDVYYEDEIILTVEKIDKKPINYIRVGYFGNNQKIIDTITFGGYSLREINEIYDYMDTNFIVSQNGDVGKRYSFINENLILEIGFAGNCYEKSTAISIIVGIREVKE